MGLTGEALSPQAPLTEAGGEAPGGMALWFTEYQRHGLGLTCRVTQSLHVRQTRFQHLAVLDTEPFGRMLVLDGMVQLTLADEFVYHEMLAHVPLAAHAAPRRVLVVGGGDGGTVREVLRHPTVESVVLAELDAEVVEVCREYLPEVAGALSDPRVHIAVGDGVAHVREHPQAYDVILIDSTEPLGFAEGLFRQEFYASCRQALRPGGILAAQTESPFYNLELLRRSFRHMQEVFGQAGVYLASIPTYPSGLWSFTAGSLGPALTQVHPAAAGRVGALATRYYHRGLHGASFVLPQFVRQALEAAVQEATSR